MNLNYLLVFGIILFLRFYGENNDLYTGLGLIVIFFIMKNITEGIVVTQGGSEEKTMIIHEEDPRLINILELLNNLDQNAINKLHENGLNEEQFKFFTDYLSNKNLTTLDQIYDIDTINFNDEGNFKNEYYTKNPQQSMTTDQVKGVFSYIKNNPETFITMNFLQKYIRERYGRVTDLQGGDIPEEIYEHINLLINKFGELSKGELIGFYDVIKTNSASSEQELSDELSQKLDGLMVKLIQPKGISFEYSRFMFPTFILLMISFFDNFVQELSRTPNISDEIYQYVEGYITSYCSDNPSDTRCEAEGIPSPEVNSEARDGSHRSKRTAQARDLRPAAHAASSEPVDNANLGAGAPSPEQKCTDYTCSPGTVLKSNSGNINQDSSPQQNCCVTSCLKYTGCGDKGGGDYILMADPENIARGENPEDSCCIQTCKDYKCNTGTLKSNYKTIIRSSMAGSVNPEVNCCENPCSSPLNYFADSSPNCICSPLSDDVGWFDDDDRTGLSLLDGLFCLKGEWGGVLIVIGIICAVAIVAAAAAKIAETSKSRSKTTSIRSSQNPSVPGVNVNVGAPTASSNTNNSKSATTIP